MRLFVIFACKILPGNNWHQHHVHLVPKTSITALTMYSSGATRSKLIFLFTAIVLFQTAFCQLTSQWGLSTSFYYRFQYNAGANTLAMNSKYTKNNYITTLYNNIYYSTQPNLYNNLLEPADYLSGSRFSPYGGIVLSKKDRTGASPILIFLSGSTTNYARDFEEDANGNFVVLMDTKGNGWNQFPLPKVNSNRNDSTQIVLCKVDGNSNAIWTKIYGGSSAEYAVAIKKTSDGNYLVLAQTQSGDGDVTGYNGGKDIWLMKVDDANGNILWKKTIGSNKDDVPTDMEILPDGSIVISGSADASTVFPSTYAGQNGFLLKLDAGGNMIWTKTFGGNGNDQVKSFTSYNDGGYISIGTSTSADGDYPVNNGGSDVYIFRHNATGDILWRKQYGFANDDLASDIAFLSCDSTIYASWFKQYGGPIQPFSVYPAYSQNAGVRVALKSDGTQTSYFQDNHPYIANPNDEVFNNYITQAIIKNNRGGILCTSMNHLRWLSFSTPPAYWGNVTRTYTVTEYGGYPLNFKNFDTSICKGQFAYVQIFSSDTTFSDTLRNNCNIDTLIKNYKIHIINADSLIIKDSSICYGGVYKGNPVYNSFTDHDTSSMNTICGPKLVIKQVNVHVSPAIINPFGKDSTLCNNQSIILKAFTPAQSYLWQDNTTQNTYSVSTAGLYWVEVTDSYGCKKRDSITIIASDLFLSVPAGSTINFPAQVTLAPQTNGNITWTFDPSLSCTACQTTIASPVNTATYFLTAQKGNCILSGSIKINVIKGFYLYIPNAITPNGDTKNDQFKVFTTYTGFFRMEVFNRYGERVFSTNTPAAGWNGKYKAADQPNGSYSYFVQYKNEKDELVTLKGNFLLIR